MLPEPLPRFWSAWRGLGAARRATPWGEVVSDPRFPVVWESNHAAVLRHHAEVSPEDLRTALIPALEEAGAAYEHVEFWDPPEEPPALSVLAAGAQSTGTDAVMRYRGDPDGPAADPRGAGIRVEELAAPDEGFWSVYRSSRNEFGGDTMDGEVIDQLVRRDRELLVPAGLRAFGAFLDDTLAGFVTLISLDGVGYVDNVVTLPAFRRRGVAGAGVGAAVRASLRAGDAAVHLLTDEGSDAQRLYERLGFEQVARVRSVTRRLRG